MDERERGRVEVFQCQASTKKGKHKCPNGSCAQLPDGTWVCGTHLRVYNLKGKVDVGS